MTEVYVNGIFTCETDSVSISRVDRCCVFLPKDGTVVDFLPETVVFKEYRDGSYRQIRCHQVERFQISSQGLHRFWFTKLEITTTESYGD